MRFSPVTRRFFLAFLNLTLSAFAGCSIAVNSPSPQGGTIIQAIIEGPDSVKAGGCDAFQLKLNDSAGQPYALPDAVSFSWSQLPGSIYSDPACTTALTSFVAPAGSSKLTFYFQSTVTAKTVTTFTAAGGSVAPVLREFAVLPGAAKSLKLKLLSSDPAVAGNCYGASLYAADAFGNSTGADVTADLSSSLGSLFFYSSSACDPTMKISSGALSASAAQPLTVYFRGTLAGSDATLMAKDRDPSSGIASASATLNLGAAPAAKLTFLSAPETVVAGDCKAFTLAVTDSFGNLAVHATQMVTVGATPNVLFSNVACDAKLTAPLSVASSDSASFYLKDLNAEMVTLSASIADTSFTANASVKVLPGDANRLRMDPTTDKLVKTAGDCVPMRVGIADKLSNATSTGAEVMVKISSDHNGKLFSDSVCKLSATTVKIPANSSDFVTFYFKSLKAESDTVSFADAAAGLSGGTGSIKINGAAPKLLSLAGNRTGFAGTFTAFTLKVTDAFGNLPTYTGTTGSITVPVDVTVTGSAKLYADAQKHALALPLTFSAAASGQKMVYVYDETSEAVGLKATSTASGITEFSTSLSILAAAATLGKINIVTGPAYPNVVSPFAGECIGIGMSFTDAFKNPAQFKVDTTFDLKGSGDTAWFSDYECKVSTTSVTIPGFPTDGSVGSSPMAVAYFRHLKAEPMVIAATDPLQKVAFDPVDPFTINPGIPHHLMFAGAPPAVFLGQCLPFVVNLFDAGGNITKPLPGAPVEFLANGALVSASTGCPNAAPGIALPMLPSGAVTVFLAVTKVGPVSLTARYLADSRVAAAGLGFSAGNSPCFLSGSGPFHLNQPAPVVLISSTGGIMTDTLPDIGVAQVVIANPTRLQVIGRIPGPGLVRAHVKGCGPITEVTLPVLIVP